MRVLFLRGFFVCFVGVCAFVSVSFAQQHGAYDAFEVLVSERYPSPGAYVTFTVQSNKVFSSNIRSVRWHVDSIERREYENKFEITEIAGGVPKQVTARIHYYDSRGRQRYAEVSRWMRPVIFDIFWEADSVTTPLYRGHKLAGPEVPIILSANIQYTDQNGITYTEKDFSFRWMIESRYHSDRGPGVSSVVYTEGGDYLNRYLIVQVEALLIHDGSVSFEKVTNVPIVEPRMLVYPHTLLYGLSRDRVISDDLLFGSERVTASVYPFYFSRDDFEKNAIHYSWFVNNETVPLKEGRKLDISVEGAGTEIPVRVFAQNENKDLQQTDILFTFRL